MNCKTIDEILSTAKIDKNGRIMNKGRLTDRIHALHLQSVSKAPLKTAINEFKDPAFLGNVCLSYRHDFGLIENMEKANVKFILVHKDTGAIIEMPVMGICEEYSKISFSTRREDYNGDYNGIGRLPSYHGNDTADEYNVFVVINGVKFEYNGLYYDPKNPKEYRKL